MTRPRLFIGSSAESLEIAYAIQANLQRDAEVTVWNQGVFEPGQYTLESLTEVLEQTDFGAFLFAPDDVIRIREQTASAVRDNVIFELGLCVGALGRRRGFIFRPQGVRDFRLPTDLLGLTPAEYEADRTDKNWRAAVGPACASVGAVIRKLGPRNQEGAAPISPATVTLKLRAAALLRACEAAAGAAQATDNRLHPARSPEWRQVARLTIGQYRGDSESVVYVQAKDQHHLSSNGEKKSLETWYKWYVGTPQPNEPDDTYVLFEELPRLLRRPGDLSFEAGESIPAWVKEELKVSHVTAIQYHSTKIY